MAASANDAHTETIEEVTRTEGKAWGPVSQNITVSGLIATCLIYILSLFGIELPAEVALAFATLIYGAIGWFTKGRVVVKETTTAPPVSDLPANEPLFVPDGDGSHRAESVTPTNL